MTAKSWVMITSASNVFLVKTKCTSALYVSKELFKFRQKCQHYFFNIYLLSEKVYPNT